MKKDNKGFSLVELIVVIAIMAVLMTVLAPQLLRYVEKTRLQKDNSAISEIANAIELAMADPTINAATPSGTTVTIAGDEDADKTITFGTSALETELARSIGASFTTGSNTYKESGDNIVLTITITDGVVSIQASGWYDTPDDAASSTENL